ncbi:uncharacterized protein CTRU02_215381 [Colletotrichum truncatum]|uniref:Secreted protein n=1 Tax=Colletotrichum truncatum TaxID=5467 RepID=A0ACC3YD12_COLTU|nr:uncharacterized protein CTRU02_13337 [Colletotrichum truncatum]KAF6783574.1 secreted protein [Colletotrichum truncatum]
MRFTALIGFVTSTTAAALSVPAGPPQPLGEIGWEGIVTPGGPIVEDIESKIRKEQPDFSIYTKEEQASPETSTDPTVISRGLLERR